MLKDAFIIREGTPFDNRAAQMGQQPQQPAADPGEHLGSDPQSQEHDLTLRGDEWNAIMEVLEKAGYKKLAKKVGIGTGMMYGD